MVNDSEMSEQDLNRHNYIKKIADSVETQVLSERPDYLSKEL
jgi:uncharacterized protein YnzC (UPF0291/DUF896 family)